MSQMKARKDIPEELTWDLTALFDTKEDFEVAVKEIATETERFAEEYDGKLKNAESIIQALDELAEIRKIASWVSQYATLPTSADISDAEAMETLRSVRGTLATVGAKLSFVDSQLVASDEKVLNQVAIEKTSLASFIRKIKKQKRAQLDPAVEKALAQLNPVLSSPVQIFEQARSSDMDFGTFMVNGQEYPLSFVLYEEFYMYHPETEIRRAAFDKFSSVLSKYKNVVATAYYTQLQKEKTLATMRGYDSIFDYLLESQEVDPELYHRQIDKIMTDFAPVMRKFIDHLKEVNGLDKMTFADLKIDLDSDYTESVTVEESKALVEASLQPMGKDYVNLIMRSYPERWVDFAQNKGKRSGAFCSTTQGKHPYILMSWTDQLTDVYTLMHELGHAGQGVLSNENHSVLGSRMSLYQIEAPSTFHELLLTDYLKEKSDTARAERSVLSMMISKTYFHNFVTHLLEAAYQREVYRLVDAGKGFDADTLSKLKRGVLEQFWGESVELNPGAELTWMRQIHYYMGLYPYTYSAGLTIATQAFLKLKENGSSQMEAWLEFLALGGEKVPQDAAKVANVNIDTDQPLDDTIRYLDESVNRIIQLTEEMKK